MSISSESFRTKNYYSETLGMRVKRKGLEPYSDDHMYVLLVENAPERSVVVRAEFNHWHTTYCDSKARSHAWGFEDDGTKHEHQWITESRATVRAFPNIDSSHYRSVALFGIKNRIVTVPIISPIIFSAAVA